MNAPAVRANAHKEPQRAPNPIKYPQNFGENALAVSSSELLILNSRFGVGCAGLS
jgi:hypothetical protein